MSLRSSPASSFARRAAVPSNLGRTSPPRSSGSLRAVSAAADAAPAVPHSATSLASADTGYVTADAEIRAERVEAAYSGGPSRSGDVAKVFVHACGRSESLSVERISVTDVCRAARLAFDFPPDQELVLTDKNGELIASDGDVQQRCARSETVHIRLSDGALHEFERRVDELQHMQLGYLCDQLATFRQELIDLSNDCRSMRATVDLEKTARELMRDAFRKESEDTRKLAQNCINQGDDKIAAIESIVYELRQSMQEEAIVREHASQETVRQFVDVRDGLATEAKSRADVGAKLRLELEDLQRAMNLEISDREDCEVRMERGMQSATRSIFEASEKAVTEAGEVRNKLVDVQQAVTTEQRERITADAGILGAVKDIRLLIQKESRDRIADHSTVFSRCNDLEMTVNSEKLARQQAATELTQQLSVAVESIQEEQTLRSSEDAELSQMLEGLRRSVDELRRRHEENELASSRLAHEVGRRVDEEVHARDMEVSKLHRFLGEEREARQDAHNKIDRTLSGFRETYADSAKVRELHTKNNGNVESLQSQVKTLAEHIHSHRGMFGDEQRSAITETSSGLRDLQTMHDSHRKTSTDQISSITQRLDEVVRKTSDLHANHAELKDRLHHTTSNQQGLESEVTRHVQTSLEKEAAAREKGDSMLALSVEATEEDVRGVKALIKENSQFMEESKSVVANMQKMLRLESGGVSSGDPLGGIKEQVRTECLEVVHGDLGALRAGLTKVVEAVQQERKSRTENVNKLREDCREAIQKEINARLERDKEQREEASTEARSRLEGFEVIQAAMEEVRNGLETHTHDVTVEDDEGSDDGTVGSGSKTLPDSLAATLGGDGSTMSGTHRS